MPVRIVVLVAAKAAHPEGKVPPVFALCRSDFSRDLPDTTI